MDIVQFARLAKKARKHVVKYAEEYTEDLSGACGIASLHLMRLANQSKVFPTFVAGYFSMHNDPIHNSPNSHGHCWIEYRGAIVDITATQFSDLYNPIHVVPIYNSQYGADFKTNSSTEAYENIREWAIYNYKLRFLSR